jgi:hypothetical protein
VQAEDLVQVSPGGHDRPDDRRPVQHGVEDRGPSTLTERTLWNDHDGHVKETHGLMALAWLTSCLFHSRA